MTRIPAETALPGEDVADPFAADPAGEAMLADSVGPALRVVLDTLTPARRLAYALQHLSAVPFEEIATIVDRTPTHHAHSPAAVASDPRTRPPR